MFKIEIENIVKKLKIQKVILHQVEFVSAVSAGGSVKFLPAV